MQETSAEQVMEWMREGRDDVLLLDIRPPADFAEWRIPGSVNADVMGLQSENPAAARAMLEELPEGSDVVTVCRGGVASQRTTELLNDMGRNALTLRGGLMAWARVHTAAPVPAAVEGTLTQVARPGTGCLSYVLTSGGDAVVVDPTRDLAAYNDVLEAQGARLVGVLETHAHADHLSGARALAERHGVPHRLHAADAGSHADDAPLRHGDTLAVGRAEVEVIHTPGHTPGSVALRVGDALLTGDTLFIDSVGRPDLDAGHAPGRVRENARRLHESLRRLTRLDGNPLVLPAHDPGAPMPPVAARLEQVLRDNGALGLGRKAFVSHVTAERPAPPDNHEAIKAINVGEKELGRPEEADALELGPNRCAAR